VIFVEADKEEDVLEAFEEALHTVDLRLSSPKWCVCQ
jgi:hypothetical protein